MATLNSKFIHTNLAIRYIKKMIEGICSAEIEEYTINMDLNDILSDIYKRKPDVLILSTYIWNVDSGLKLSATLKDLLPDMKIVMGGPEVSFNCGEFMKKNESIDYIIHGEGEITAREFIEMMNSKMDMKNIDGLAYRKDGETIVNKSRTLIDDLDIIKSPYEDIDKDDYKNKIVYYETSRGCPFNCEYCLSAALKGIRFFSLDRVKSDIRNLIDSGVKQIKFIDRTFNIGSKRTIELINFLMDIDDGNINFHLEIAAHVMDDEVVEFLKKPRPGLFQFEIGVQSTNLDTLNEIGRYQDFKKLKSVVEKVNSYKNIHQHLDLIVGLPYEGYESFKRSFNDVFNLNIGHLQVGFLKVLKGSPLKEKVERHGIKYRKYPPYEVLETSYISFGEVQKIKQVEHLLETYWNSKNFAKSMKYLLSSFYKTNPFKMFEEISNYWSEKGLFDLSHNKNALYEIMMDFYGFNNFPDADLFRDYLRFDYLSLGKTSYVPDGLRAETDKIEDFANRCHKFLQDEENIRELIPKYEGTPAKKIMKKVHFEVFNFNFDEIETSGYKAIDRQNSVYIFIYDLDRKIFSKSRSFKVTI